MHMQVTELAGRERVLAVTDNHPYARLSIGDQATVRGFTVPGATAWLGTNRHRPIASALGEAEPAAQLLKLMIERGELAGVTRLHLPRIAHGTLAEHLPVADPADWDFRWSRLRPPRQPAQSRTVPLVHDDGPTVTALLGEAFPDSYTTPGDPRVRRWYGIWEGPRLVACGADQSRGGVGSIGALAVHPDRRGRGLGTAVTAAMTSLLLRKFPLVTLGVMADNQPAARLYARLGFVHATGRTAVNLRAPGAAEVNGSPRPHPAG